MKTRVLFVCLGNICRSPAAEGAFRHLVQKKNLEHLFEIDSCGTAGYHIGEYPHSVTRQVAKNWGIQLEHRCRQFSKKDFDLFDYILVMDESNLSDVLRMAPNVHSRKKVMKFRKFDLEVEGEPDVPDPYSFGIEKFEEVQKIVTRASEGFLNWIIKNSNDSFEK